MSLYRLQIVMLFLAPVLVLAGAFALGQVIPLPLLGRDYVIRVELPEPGSELGLPEVQGPPDSTRPLVVIDAGHGGHDPGASGVDFTEKTLVLGLARALRDRLLEEGGIRVAMTRADDRFLALSERVDVTRRLNADLFVSIHADSAGTRDQVTGASIYTLSDVASSEAAARFAARENEADRINGVDISGGDDTVNAILVELSQRRTSQSSVQFAELIVREGETALNFHEQPLRSAALAVLRAPDVPSVLFESGYITNQDEAQRLASAEGQQAFAAAMARAIRVFFARASTAG
ncbi:MAG: N-acetylmuramoyl-L-alanine amidase [Alteraurantiacibacter sp.]